MERFHGRRIHWFFQVNCDEDFRSGLGVVGNWAYNRLSIWLHILNDCSATICWDGRLAHFNSKVLSQQSGYVLQAFVLSPNKSCSDDAIVWFDASVIECWRIRSLKKGMKKKRKTYDDTQITSMPAEFLLYCPSKSSFLKCKFWQHSLITVAGEKSHVFHNPFYKPTIIQRKYVEWSVERNTFLIELYTVNAAKVLHLIH